MADIKCVINGPINQSSGRTDFMINYAAGIETDEQDNSLTIERSGVGVISGLRVTGTIYANSNYSFSMDVYKDGTKLTSEPDTPEVTNDGKHIFDYEY